MAKIGKYQCRLELCEVKHLLTYTGMCAVDRDFGRHVLIHLCAIITVLGDDLANDGVNNSSLDVTNNKCLVAKR